MTPHPQTNRVPLIYSGNEYRIDYDEPGALLAGGLDQACHENFKKLLQIHRDHAAFRWGTLIDLDPTANMISYARTYQGETWIVVLNNTAFSQPFKIDLGSNGILCSRVQNLLIENDPNIQLDNQGSSTASLSGFLNAWEPKIIQCEPWRMIATQTKSGLS